MSRYIIISALLFPIPRAPKGLCTAAGPEKGLMMLGAAKFPDIPGIMPPIGFSKLIISWSLLWNLELF